MLADRPRTLAYKKAIEDARSFIQDKVNTLVFSELHLWNKTPSSSDTYVCVVCYGSGFMYSETPHHGRP